MITPRATAAAYRLMHAGSIALAEAETAGIHVDMERLCANEEYAQNKINRIDAHLRTEEWSDIWPRWRKIHGDGANLGSGAQLATVLFGDPCRGGMGLDPLKHTDTGAIATDEDALAEYAQNNKWLRGWIVRNKLEKIIGTYIKNIKAESCEHVDLVTGLNLRLLHPRNALHTTDTYRSSVSSPSFQNMPVRDRRFAWLIRNAIRPRPGRRLIEIDFAGAEVRVAAGYHNDPTMLKYLAGGGDMHWDVVERLFFVKRSPAIKGFRDAIKGRFTFAEFYGDYYKSVAESIWTWIRRESPVLEDGTLLRDHLAANGITEYGNPLDKEHRKHEWLHHVQAVEHHFWKVRFVVYDKWRQDLYEEYCAVGEIVTKTGFHSCRPMSRNVLINNPIQGSSFHCLLWAFIHLHRNMERRRAPANLVAQIHDSIFADVADSFVPEYCGVARDIIETRLRRRMDWLTPGMVAEVKRSDVYEDGGSWDEMNVVKWEALVA